MPLTIGTAKLRPLIGGAGVRRQEARGGQGDNSKQMEPQGGKAERLHGDFHQAGGVKNRDARGWEGN